MKPIATVLITAAELLAAAAAVAAPGSEFSLAVLVGGAPLREYRARDAVYVEAVRGREYALRVTNPLDERVAVALAVDGLNTIDARHGDAASAAKWVLDPHETVVIAGWQVSGEEARSFYFTGERGSYGALLGRTEDLGVIEAVFFRERRRAVPVLGAAAGGERGRAAPEAAASGLAAKEGATLDDDLAATGIGERRRHEVVRVALDLEREPAASLRVRYEYRAQLERLGVVPRGRRPTPLERREGARGFEPGFCPDPGDGQRRPGR